MENQEQLEQQQHKAIYEAALQYVELGLPIIPICPYDHKKMSYSHRSRCKRPGKTPIIKDWPHRSVTTKDQVNSWFNRNEYINIGLPLGDGSHIVGIDVDGHVGHQMLKLMARDDLPPTWEFTTGNGKRYLYAIPAGLKTKKFVVNTDDAPHQELAVLCNGQQTVLPPSIHPSGAIYTWCEGRSPQEINIADAPQWLIDAITTDSGNVDEPEPDVFEPTVTKDDWDKQVSQGQRNIHLTKLAGSLISRRAIPRDQVIEFLKLWNQQHCHPPLPDAEIEKMVQSLWLSESMKAVNLKQQEPVFRPAPLAERFVTWQEELGYKWLYCPEEGNFYRCDVSTGPWVLVDDLEVQKCVRQLITNESLGGRASWDRMHYINETVAAIKEQVQSPTYGTFDIGSHPQDFVDFIPVQNGLLYWETRELKPWNPSIYTTIQLPVMWDENATYNEWDAALRAWIPDEESRMFIQEFIGLCLIPDTKHRVSVLLHGSGRNGKSLFIDCIRKLFGNHASCIPLHRLAERFEAVNLYNKLLNVCGDIDAKYLTETGTLKAIIAGDTLHAEAKFKPAFDFTPVARLLFSANDIPKSSDKTEAWYSRLAIVKFPNMFPVDPSYKSHLLTYVDYHLSGLLLWAVQGLTRLYQNGRFTISEAMREAQREYQEENDNVIAFIHECIEFVPHEGKDTVLATRPLHQTYVEWCAVNGAKPVGQIEFSKRMQAFGVKKDVRRMRGRSVNCFLGVKMSDEWFTTYNLYQDIK